MATKSGLVCVRAKTCPPHFVSLTYVGKLEGKEDKTWELSEVARFVEIVDGFKTPQGQTGMSVNISVIDDSMTNGLKIPTNDIAAFGEPSENVKKLYEGFLEQKRAAAAGLVLPGKQASKIQSV